MRVAIVGAGNIGRKRAASLPEECRLVGFSDINLYAAEALAAEFNSTAFANFEELITSLGSTGLLIISTPHNLLAEYARLGIAKGLNVLVEKPGGISEQDVKVLIDESMRAGVLVRVGYNHRFFDGIQQIKSAIDSGKHGKILNIRGRYGHGGRLGYEKEWRANRVKSGGGELIDQGSHLIDLMQFFTGRVELKYSSLTTKFWDISVEDNAHFHLRSDSGVDGWFHTSWTEWRNLFSIEIFCESAKFELQGIGGSYGKPRLISNVMSEGYGLTVETEQELSGSDSWSLEIADVLNQLKGQTYVGAGLDDALSVLRILEKAYANVHN